MPPLVRDLLPHGPPMLLVHGIDHLAINEARGWAQFEEGHYATDDGHIPRVILVEALAQLAACMAGASAGGAPRGGRLARVADFEFRGFARPGDRLELHVRESARLGSILQVDGEVRGPAGFLASGRLQFALVDETPLETTGA